MMQEKTARGLRNNNPLNIRKNRTRWKGLKKEQTDRSFFQFVAPEWGYRAAIRTIHTYYKKYRLRTLTEIISRWAPPEDNNDTRAYIAIVSRRAKIRPNVTIDVFDKDVMIRLIEAMSFVENGIGGYIEDIEKAWELL